MKISRWKRVKNCARFRKQESAVDTLIRRSSLIHLVFCSTLPSRATSILFISGREGGRREGEKREREGERKGTRMSNSMTQERVWNIVGTLRKNGWQWGCMSTREQKLSSSPREPLSTSTILRWRFTKSGIITGMFLGKKKKNFASLSTAAFENETLKRAFSLEGGSGPARIATFKLILKRYEAEAS